MLTDEPLQPKPSGALRKATERTKFILVMVSQVAVHSELAGKQKKWQEGPEVRCAPVGNASNNLLPLP